MKKYKEIIKRNCPQCKSKNYRPKNGKKIFTDKKIGRKYAGRPIMAVCCNCGCEWEIGFEFNSSNLLGGN